jgi:hypothetical protein
MVARFSLALALVGIAWAMPAQAATKQKALAATPPGTMTKPMAKSTRQSGALANGTHAEQAAADIDSEATAGPAKQRALRVK